jgi:hypothetical protein
MQHITNITKQGYMLAGLSFWSANRQNKKTVQLIGINNQKLNIP